MRYSARRQVTMSGVHDSFAPPIAEFVNKFVKHLETTMV